MAKRVKPGLSQRAVLNLDASQLATGIAALVVSVIFAVVAIGALTFNDASWSERFRENGDAPEQTLQIVAAVAGGLCVLTFLAAVYGLRRHRLARNVRELSEDPRLAASRPVPRLEPPAHRAQVVPPLDVQFRTARKMGKFRNPRQVTGAQNVSGRRPLTIVYLRLFENQSRIRTFMEGAWREFGYVHLLRSADAVSPLEYRRARDADDFARFFISDANTMISRLEAAPAQPLRKGRHKLTEIGPEPIRVRDKYGSYPVRALLCHGSFWQQAVDILLDRADLVVVDLSGFTDRNVGTLYELQRVIDRFPIERALLLSDPLSKDKYLAANVQQAWSQMAAGSPNSGMARRVATIVETDYFHRSSDSSGSDRTSLVARPKHTRQLASLAQDHVERFASTRS